MLNGAFDKVCHFGFNMFRIREIKRHISIFKGDGFKMVFYKKIEDNVG